MNRSPARGLPRALPFLSSAPWTHVVHAPLASSRSRASHSSSPSTVIRRSEVRLVGSAPAAPTRSQKSLGSRGVALSVWPEHATGRARLREERSRCARETSPLVFARFAAAFAQWAQRAAGCPHELTQLTIETPTETGLRMMSRVGGAFCKSEWERVERPLLLCAAHACACCGVWARRSAAASTRSRDASTGESPSAKAPDSGSANRRFGSFLPSSPTTGRSPSPAPPPSRGMPATPKHLVAAAADTSLR